VRRGEGPRFLEVHAYRWKEHVGPNEDWGAGYRAEGDAAPWWANDPVRRLGESLPASERAAIEAAVEAEIAAAIDFAEQSPWPAAEALFADVWAGAESVT
jgi:pyruvate dehydrogenase E1 component alpha subunit